MNLSINARHFCMRSDGTSRSMKDVLTCVKNAGFNYVDILVPHSDIPETVNLLEQTGLSVNQSHCPFNRYEKKDYADFAKDIMDAAVRAHALGSKIFVVHGDEFDFDSMTYTKQAALEFNYKLFSPVAEYLSQHNMKLAFENLFCDGGPRFCSDTDELCMLTDKFPRDAVGICWDTGHGKVSDPKNYIANMSSVSDRIISTHIHDNNHDTDMHLFPYLGNLDWKSAAKVLKDSGYKGEFTYEFVYDRIPDEFLGDVLSLLYRMGEYIINL